MYLFSAFQIVTDRCFVTNNNDSDSVNQEVLSQKWSSTVARIIDKIAGNQANLQIDVQELTFNIGKTKHTLTGKVNFNVVHLEEPQK